jgi:hypothetical protein
MISASSAWVKDAGADASVVETLPPAMKVSKSCVLAFMPGYHKGIKFLALGKQHRRLRVR